MTKGKLVFLVLLIVILCIDSINIYMYGNPFIESPTGGQFLVATSIIVGGFVGIIGIVIFIVTNWNEPFKRNTYDG